MTTPATARTTAIAGGTWAKSMDVVLCMNLDADVLSDLGAETAAGLDLAPSGCFDDGWASFASVHGSAPDISGKGIANPTTSIRSAVMMLEHRGWMGLGGGAARGGGRPRVSRRQDAHSRARRIREHRGHGPRRPRPLPVHVTHPPRATAGRGRDPGVVRPHRGPTPS